MIRTKGEAGTGNFIEAVRHMRLVQRAIEDLRYMNDDDIYKLARNYSLAYTKLLSKVREFNGMDSNIREDEPVYGDYTLNEIINGLYKELMEIKKLQRLPVVNFAAGGIATPADAALMMNLGADGVFVGSGIFKSPNPEEMARAIVDAVMHYDEPEVIAEVSKGLKGMYGQEIEKLSERLQERGW